MWHLKSWVNSGLGSAGLMVEFDDHRSIFQYAVTQELASCSCCRDEWKTPYSGQDQDLTEQCRVQPRITPLNCNDNFQTIVSPSSFELIFLLASMFGFFAM